MHRLDSDGLGNLAPILQPACGGDVDGTVLDP